MSKEQKFHNLIREQDSEGKERIWNKIEEHTDKSEQVDIGGGVLAKKQVLSRQSKFIVCVAALFMLIAGAVLVCMLVPYTGNDITDDFRYCEFGDYYSVDSDESIKDYAATNNLNLLYFRWYDESLLCVDTKYKLKDNDEIICICEELIDENEVFIVQYITDKNTQIDFLKVNIESCISQTNINSVEINYGTVMENTYAYFTFGEYNYYFKLEISDEDYLLLLLEDLIK